MRNPLLDRIKYAALFAAALVAHAYHPSCLMVAGVAQSNS